MSTLKTLTLVILIQCTIFTESSQQPKQKKVNGYGDNVFNVIGFGAIGDGTTDDSKGFKQAWDVACNSSAPSPTVLVPQGKTFLLQPLTLNGKLCTSNPITFQIDGRIIAPSKAGAWQCRPNCDHWISFRKCDGLLIKGSGTINGQGSNWWRLSCKNKNKACPSRKPTGFVIEDSNNVEMNGITFEDSPKMHIAFERSTLVHAANLTIKAPKNSPNTDGIHIQHSTNVSIHNSIIQTGDDCVSIGNGSKYINISNIECGPGHGISIGSLGINGKTEEVEFVHVRNVTFHGTTNGVRIKTWQGGHGHARNIKFEHIISHASTRPIIIDQYYCPHKHCRNQTSAVEISNVTYEDIQGTSSRRIAVELSCSESTPCTNIIMKDITLRYKDQNAHTSSTCLNAHGFRIGRVEPNVPCLQKHDNL
ncbi:hypothetical protein like AT1G70500 [Hibiscus trionum]|uniref:endo-polygalacturonase n=1 Tax=Hibiscus trionum TaxID=183268 RepID=A0A9W7IE81_HIBTR|nr:hypothetical protein like AT1G70500 [Hibiscus trionum]